MRTLCILLIVVCLGVLGCDRGASEDGQSKVWVLKLGHLANEDHVWHRSALKLAELAEEKSGGRLIIKVYPNEQLGKELDMINGILGGTVDMTITGESLQNWAEELAMCAVPYAIGNDENLRDIAGGAIGRELERVMIDQIGLRPVTWLQRGARNLTSNRPIERPEDLQGIILRVPNVNLYVKTWQGLGAKPTPMAFSEVFTSLQQHTIEAQENPLALIYSAGFYEVQKYCNLTEHVRGWVYVVVGEAQFRRLPEDLQEIFLAAAAEMHEYYQDLFAAEQEALKKTLEEKGMVFVQVDQQAFEQKARQAVLDALTPGQRELYQRMIAVE